MLADVHSYMLIDKRPGLTLHWPVASSGNRFLLHVLSLLPSLPLPSLHLHTLNITPSSSTTNSPLSPVEAIDWSPRSLHTLKDLAISNATVPFDSLNYITLFTRLTKLQLISARESARPPATSVEKNPEPSLYPNLHLLTNLRELTITDRLDGKISSRFLETFTSAIGQLSLLTSLDLHESMLCPAGMQSWVGLQSLRDLNLCSVTYRWPDVVTTELCFLSRLTTLTRLQMQSEEGKFLGSEFDGLSCLSGLEELSINCHSEHELMGVARVAALKSLVLKVGRDSCDAHSLSPLSSLSTLHSLSLTCTIEDKSQPFIQRVAEILPHLQQLEVDLICPRLDDMAAMSAVRQLEQLTCLTIYHKAQPPSLKGLATLTNLHTLRLCHPGLIEEHFQAISRLPSIQSLDVSHAFADRSSLRWLRYMRNLKAVKLRENGFARNVVPREITLGNGPRTPREVDNGSPSHSWDGFSRGMESESMNSENLHSDDYGDALYEMGMM